MAQALAVAPSTGEVRRIYIFISGRAPAPADLLPAASPPVRLLLRSLCLGDLIVCQMVPHDVVGD